MISIERLQRVRFNASELVSILMEKQFNYRRAGDWMDEHFIFSLQVVAAYLVSIFTMKYFMKNRQPFSLKTPLAAWNGFIAALSGICVLAMAREYFETLYVEGVNNTLCFTQDQYFGGSMIGRAVFILILARLPELLDTYFIVLRKQPLIFLHWYHHTVTLTVAWFTYSARFSGTVHLVLVNAMIHTVMYSYYFLTAVGIKPHPLVAQSITVGQILQFFYAMYGLLYVTAYHFTLGEPCNVDGFRFFIHWVMVTSYTYLFVDFYLNKYQRVKAERAEEKANMMKKVE